MATVYPVAIVALDGTVTVIAVITLFTVVSETDHGGLVLLTLVTAEPAPDGGVTTQA
jgi:hypothetical protein